MAVALVLVSSFAAVGCAPPPRPPALAQAQSVRAAPAMREASRLAPQAMAHADAVLREAQDAYERGELAASEILAERAAVAFERAAVLARIVRASTSMTRAGEELSRSQTELASLDAERRRLEADIDTTEKLIRVIGDAEPITPSKPGQHQREAARMKACRSIIVDARLLCISARLVSAEVEGLAAAEAEVKRLEDALAQWPQPAPIDESLRARTACLSMLTLARRSSSVASSGLADVVLSDLSSVGGVEPYRDDRGIVVVVRGNPNASDASNEARYRAVLATATKFKEFPLLIVSHTRGKPSGAELERARQRGDQVARKLEAGGIEAKRMSTERAGGDRPIVHDPIPAPRNSQNERVEIVFILPAS